MHQHGSKYFARRHTFHLGLASKGQNIFFLKVVMVYINLKGMEHRAIVSTYFFLTHTLGPWGGVKRSKNCFFFLKVVMLHIKLKGMEHRAPCKLIVCLYTHPGSLGWGQNFFSSESRHVAYQIKGNGA